MAHTPHLSKQVKVTVGAEPLYHRLYQDGMPQPSIMDTGPHCKQVDNMWSLSLPQLAEQNSLQAWHDRGLKSNHRCQSAGKQHVYPITTLDIAQGGAVQRFTSVSESCNLSTASQRDSVVLAVTW